MNHFLRESSLLVLQSSLLPRKVVRFEDPDEDGITTSYAERLNLSVRMQVRRFTRLTNAHSKTRRHHAVTVSLFAAFYNFCRKNDALKKQTPAMASGLSGKPWTLKELLPTLA